MKGRITIRPCYLGGEMATAFIEFNCRNVGAAWDTDPESDPVGG